MSLDDGCDDCTSFSATGVGRIASHEEANRALDSALDLLEKVRFMNDLRDNHPFWYRVYRFLGIPKVYWNSKDY